MPRWRLSKVVADAEGVTGAVNALSWLLSAFLVQGLQVYTRPTPEGGVASPAVQISGVPERTADRLRRALLRFSDDITAITQLPGVSIEPRLEGCRAGRVWDVNMPAGIIRCRSLLLRQAVPGRLAGLREGFRRPLELGQVVLGVLVSLMC